uniref:5-hydroxytryptamine receptor 3B n=1 Tax=Ornithorhynchus anatinus TaxID=9258 RepID=F7BSJ4_ORNAN
MQPTTVYLDLLVNAVLDVDAQNQRVTTSVLYLEIWKNEFLAWDGGPFGGIGEISLPLDDLWAPDIIINELVKEEQSSELPYVYLNSSGMIRRSLPIQVVSACYLETYAFPFDIQNCSLTFNSALHTVSDVDLALLRSAEDIENDKQVFLNDSEWELLAVPAAYRVLHSQTGDFAQIQFHVVIRRRPLLYVVSLLLPSIFLTVMDLGSFYLPPHCGTQITFKTSILVGYTVFKVNISEELPKSTASTPLIGVFFTVCMAFLVLSLSESILLVRFLHRERREGQEQPLSSLRRSPGSGSCSPEGNARPAGSPLGEADGAAGTGETLRRPLGRGTVANPSWTQGDSAPAPWVGFLGRTPSCAITSP